MGKQIQRVQLLNYRDTQEKTDPTIYRPYFRNNHTMTSSIGNIYRITGSLCGEIIGHRWIPLTKASDAVLWRFLLSVPE